MSIGWQLIGALAMLCIEASYVPQVVKLYRIKNAEDFSIFFPLLNGTGRVLGLIYTGLNGDIVLAVGFSMGIFLRFMLLVQVWYYKRKKRLERQEAEASQVAPNFWDRLQTWTDSVQTAEESRVAVNAGALSYVQTSKGSEALPTQATSSAEWCHPGDACVPSARPGTTT